MRRDIPLRICADVGGSFVDIAVVDETMTIRHRQRMPTPVDDWQAFVALLRGVQHGYADMVTREQPLSIAMASIVDPVSGVTTCANIPCVHDRPLAQDLSAELGQDILVTNDADCFALAEARLGVARGHQTVFGIILGTGVGGGLVHNGRLLAGGAGVVGEWGHGPVITRSLTDPDATPYFRCGCGQYGCLDTVGAARGLERLHLFLHGTPAQSREITARWMDGDAVATRTIDYYADLLSGHLAAAVNTTGATIVPVGGGLSGCAPLVERLDAEVRARMLKPRDFPLLVRTKLGGVAGLLGAAIIAADMQRRP